MSHISPSILRGLSKLVPESLNYVCYVEYDNARWYLGLGRRSFYFIDEELRRFKDPAIPYSKIEACRICPQKKTLIQIALKLDDKCEDHENPSPDHAIWQTYKHELNIYN